MNDKLLIFDINEVLCCKLSKNKYIYTDDMLECNSYYIKPRPGYREFMNLCYENYNVAFFSSTNTWNVIPILKFILTENQYNNTKFIWCRDRTRFDPCPCNIYDTIKNLNDIYENPVINTEKLYNNMNTILVDNSIIKTRFNNPKNIIICESYQGDVSDNVLYQLYNIIQKKFLELQ